MKGFVKWFSYEKRFGFIVGENDTEYFVHFNSVVSDDFSLEKGDRVSFTVGSNDKGPMAVNVQKLNLSDWS